MNIWFNDRHARHAGRQEMFRGRLVDCFEVPQRAELVLQAVQARGLGTVCTAPDIDDALLARVHTPAYLRFLAHAWDDWVALDPANAQHDALPAYWPAPGMRRDIEPLHPVARLGFYGFDAGSPITAGTWVAARQGAACAAAAARDLLGGARNAFVLSRPPGHHAGADFFGGYCFLNNAAIAAQALRDGGVERVAVLDIDFHHGNGTQAIFWERADVVVASVHGDPATEYPYYLGHADERGAGAGLGCNLNIPLPRGTGFTGWREALQVALAELARHRPGALVVSLGLDTFEQDPISGFLLRSEDYLQVGQDLAAAGLPTVFVLEGGYAVAEVGTNAANVLQGFLGG